MKVAPARSTIYYRTQEASEAALVLMHRIDALHREHRFADTVAGRSFNQPQACSIDGPDCWHDNVFIERLWNSIKYDEMSLRAYEAMNAAYDGIGRYPDFYHSR